MESSYLLNGSNLYDFNYSSGISLETKLPLTKEGTVVYRFNKDQPESLEQALFLPKLLAWDEGPIEDAGGSLRWELSGDLSAVDVSGFQEETGGTGLTGNGEEIMLFTPEESGLLTVRVSAADDPTKTASCRVLLLEENAVDRITVSPEELRIRAGQTYHRAMSQCGKSRDRGAGAFVGIRRVGTRLLSGLPEPTRRPPQCALEHH